MKETAYYHDQKLVEFMGNPLIEALPPMEAPENYPKRLMVLPAYSDEDREMDATYRLARLQGFPTSISLRRRTQCSCSA